MSITTLPTPPSTNDPLNFSAQADALLSALPLFVAETNATAAAMSLNATNGTSSSSILIGTGSKTLTANAGKSWQLGMTLKIASTASPTNSMLADVTAYDVNTGIMTVSCTSVSGSGTFSSWTISQGGTSSSGVVFSQKGLQIFSANGNFTVPNGVTSIYVTAVAGGGGSGGGGGNNTANAAGSPGGGAGSGEAILKQVYSVTPAQVIAITIGLGGTFGTGGSSSANDATAGGNGTNTIIGSLITLIGGNGSGPGQLGSSSVISGGTAGTPNGTRGTQGGPTGGFIHTGESGHGGGNIFGPGGLPKKTNYGAVGGPGSMGSAWGSGASGGGSTSSGASAGTYGFAGGNGNNGSDGIVIIEW